MSTSRRGSTDAPDSPLMTRQLFGTDGVRGVAGELLSAELALALGRAATARVIATHAAPVAAGTRNVTDNRLSLYPIGLFCDLDRHLTLEGADRASLELAAQLEAGTRQ